MSHPTKSRIGLALLALSAAIALAACRHENPAELLRSARDYQVKGDHHAAVIQLKNALQLQTNNGEARLLLAQSALVLGDAIGAEKEFRKALEFGQPEAIVVPRLAAALLESGQFDKLIREFAGRKLGDPKAEAELRARVGDAQLRARNPQEAARFFSEALAADPSNLTALMGRVRLTAIEGRLEDALQASAQLVAANPDSVDALRLLGSIGILLGDRAGARAALERAIALAPATPYPRFELIVHIGRAHV